MATDRMAREKAASRIALPLAIALHLFVLYCWMSNRPVLPEAANRTLIVRLAASRTQQAIPADKPPAKPAGSKPDKSRRTAATPARPQAIYVTPAPDVAAPSAEKKEEPAAPPAPTVTAEDMITNARRSAGKIDRDLRKASPKLLEAAPDSIQSKLEKSIAVAAKPRSTTMEEIAYSNGRRMTKIVGPGGTYCVTEEGVGATNGLDMIQNGVRKKTTNCPD
jgi:hypothetical protein